MSLVDRVCRIVWDGVRRIDGTVTSAEGDGSTRSFTFGSGRLSLQLTEVGGDGVQYVIQGHGFGVEGIVRLEDECRVVARCAWRFLFGSYLYAGVLAWCGNNPAYEMRVEYVSQTGTKAMFRVGPVGQELSVSVRFVAGNRIDYDIITTDASMESVSSGRELQYAEAHSRILNDLELTKATTNMVPTFVRDFDERLRDLDSRLSACVMSL